MLCESCRHHERCNEMADYSRSWLFDWYVRGQTPDCVGYAPRYFHGIEGVTA